MATALQDVNTALYRLQLDDIQIGNEGAKALANALQVNTSVQILELRENQIGDEGAKALATALQSNTSLQYLSLLSNQFGDEGGRAFLNALQGFNCTLIAILMDFDGISRTIQKEIRFLLQANKRGMRIVGPSIWKEACERLRRDDKFLVRLDLGHLPVGVVGAKALADALRNNTYLKELSLEGASIGVEGAKALALALQENRHLQTLDLSNIGIEDDGAKAFADAIMTNTALKKLYISRNQICDEGAKALANALVHNSSLKQLVIEDNNIGADGGIALRQGIVSNSSHTLVKLSVKGNNIPSHALQDIDAMIPRDANDKDDNDIPSSPASSLSEKQQQKDPRQSQTTPSDLLFPTDIFRKLLEYSPVRLVHNAIGRSNRELHALAKEYDTPWPDNTILTTSATNVEYAWRSQLNQSSCGAFTLDSNRLVLTELTEFGSTPQHRALQVWDVRKGQVLRKTFAPFRGIYISPNGLCTVQCYGGHIHKIDHSITTCDVNISNTIKYRAITIQYRKKDFLEDTIDAFFSPDGGLMCGVDKEQISLFDLKTAKRIGTTFDRNIRIHKNTHPLLLNNSFMVWQDYELGVAITTLRNLNGDLTTTNNPVFISITTNKRNYVSLSCDVDSFSQCPLDESLVVSAFTEMDESSQEGQEATKIQHSLTMLKFWRPCEASGFDPDNTDRGNPDGILYTAKDLDTIVFTTTRMEGLVIDRDEIPRHKQRMAWFSDGVHLVYFYDREIHLFRVDPEAGYISKVSEDSKGLPTMLIEKANQVIDAKVPKEMYIDWMAIAPNSRTLVMRLCRFPGNEVTRIVSI